MVLTRVFIYVSAAVWQTAAAAALPVEPQDCESTNLQEILHECFGSNQVNCDNIGGVHDGTIGQGNEIVSGSTCANSGNAGEVHLNLTGPAGLPTQPGDCVDCGNVGGNFVNVVTGGDDD